jgi:hypothetical protein
MIHIATLATSVNVGGQDPAAADDARDQKSESRVDDDDRSRSTALHA